uniref:Uncharacterized protein n=1 Tax=Leptobrachium leishanense TaxID=445787 RepID=A0A8C5M8V4_9ANUR
MRTTMKRRRRSLAIQTAWNLHRRKRSRAASVSPPVPRRAPTGSVGYMYLAQWFPRQDENLFTLPAASAPLTHSSADKVLDLQQPYSTMSAGQEELASMLLEPASASSPLSPLSADSSKEQVVSVAFHANITSPEALPEPDIDTQEVSRTIGNLALTGKVDHQMEADYADDTYHKQMSSLGQAKTDVIFSEKGYIVEHPTSQQETVSEDHSQLYAQSAKEMFSGMLKSVGPPHEEFSEIKETLEQYVDFKPFVSMQPFSVGQEASVEQFKSNVYSLNVEAGKMPEEKYEDDEDLDLSDISPITPEVPDSPAYEMFAQFGKESQALGNKTDERKMEEIGSKATSVETTLKFSTANPFYEHLETQGGYVATKSVTESAATQGPTVLEGLTPDIVQEAYESETHDIGVHKLGFESKIDLVQTATKSELENAAKSVQENVSTTAQTPELFEGTNSVSSPVLPDIVMEAPLAAASTGLVASPFQPDVSPTGGAPSNSEEKIKLESEKPPSYEEAVSKSGSKNEDKAASLGETKKEPAIEDAETPYISIACDLIKETIATESTALDFSKAIKDDFESHFDDSSPESEHSEPSYKHWEHDIVLKEAVEPVKMERLGTESEFLFKESSPDHTYFDSFQPKFSQGPTEITTKNQDKPTQLHGLGFGLQSGKTPSPKYSPIEEIDDFEKASPVSFEKDLVTRVPHDVRVEVVQKSKSTEEPKAKEVPSFKKNEDVYSTLFRDPTREKVKVQEPSKEFTKAVDLTTKETFKAKDTKVSPPPQEDAPAIPPRGEKKESKVPTAAPTILAPRFKNSGIQLPPHLYNV